MAVWQKHPTMPWEELQGVKDARIRTKPDPAGRYLWQFRKTVAYASTLEAARDYVEAGAEYFAVMHRNPY